MDKFLELVQSPAVLTVAGFLVELLLRKVPSEKPLSIMLLVSKVLKMVAKGAEALSAFIDKVIPQNLKQ